MTVFTVFFAVRSVQIGMIAYTQVVSQETCVHAMHKCGLYLLPGDSDIKRLNKKLKEACLVILKPKQTDPEVDLDDVQLDRALSSVSVAKVTKARWKCPNPGCTVAYVNKAKYVKSRHPVSGNQLFFCTHH